MKTPCAFCGTDKSAPETRCQACGLGAGHLPWDPPDWERSRTLDPGASWLRALWDLLGNPSRFFAALPPSRRIWRSWTFALPLVFGLFPVVILAVIDNLALMEFRQPQLLDELSRMMGKGGLGTVEVGQSLLIMAGYWGVFVAMVATFVHLGLLMTGGAPLGWRSIFRLSGYALVPVPLSILFMLGLWLALDEVRLGRGGGAALWMRPLAVEGLVWAMLIWPFLLLVIGLEKTQGVRRGRAMSSVLLALMTGLLLASLAAS